MLRVLGPIDLDGSMADLGSQGLSLVAYLGCIGPASRDELIEALWDGRVVSAGRFANLVSTVRRQLGTRHLPPSRSGLYRLVDVDVDLDLVAEGARSASAGAAQVLAESLARATRPVMTPPAGRWWTWLDHRPELAARAEALIATQARALVMAYQAAGELTVAQELCERALCLAPLDGSLTETLEGLHRAQGHPATALRLGRRRRARLDHLGRAG